MTDLYPILALTAFAPAIALGVTIENGWVCEREKELLRIWRGK